MAGGVNEDAIEQTAITVSLKCPITQQAIRLPARGRDCKHIQCFDLENFLIMNSRKASWSCPVCKKSADIRNLEVDELIWGIINEKNPKVDEVKITPNAQWSPTPTSDVKKEPDENIGLPIKRCRTDDYQIRPQNPPDQRIMSNSQITPGTPVGPGVGPGGPMQSMQQHPVRMATQINPRLPMSHPAMINSHPSQMHPAMMNAMGTPNMTIPPNHHVTNPNMVASHPGSMSHPAMGGPVSTSMGPIGPGNMGPGQHVPMGHGNMGPGGHPHMNHHAAQMSPSVQNLQPPPNTGSPGMPMTPGGMPQTPNIPGMPPTPVMTPNSSTSSNIPPSMPHSQGVPSNGGMPPTPGMPHTPGMHPVPNIVPSPQMVGSTAPHHPVSSASYPTSVMLSSSTPAGPLKPGTPHGPMLKPPTPSMNPKTPKTPQSMGQVTTAHLTSPHPAPSPARQDLPQIAPSPQATLNGNFNSPHAITRSPNTSVGYETMLMSHSTTTSDAISYNSSLASPFSPHSNLAQTLTPLTEPTTLVSSGTTTTTMSFPPSDDITQSALDANLDDDSEIWNLFDSHDPGLLM